MRNDLQHRLGEWQRAGLISAEQVTAIAAFEQAGFVMSVVLIAVWVLVGAAWWKLLGYW